MKVEGSFYVIIDSECMARIKQWYEMYLYSKIYDLMYSEKKYMLYMFSSSVLIKYGKYNIPSL